jgi:hypothetical protein
MPPELFGVIASPGLPALALLCHARARQIRGVVFLTVGAGDEGVRQLPRIPLHSKRGESILVPLRGKEQGVVHPGPPSRVRPGVRPSPHNLILETVFSENLVEHWYVPAKDR